MCLCKRPLFRQQGQTCKVKQVDYGIEYVKRSNVRVLKQDYQEDTTCKSVLRVKQMFLQWKQLKHSSDKRINEFTIAKFIYFQ